MPSYSTLLRNFLAEEELHEQFKRETIVKMAQQLEKENFPLDQINNRIAEDLQSHASKQYIGFVLKDTKYKDTSKIHKKKKIVEITLDGLEIESDYEKEKKEEAEANKIGHQEFTEALDKIAEESSKEIQSLDSMVLKELDQLRDEKKELEIKLQNAINLTEKQKEFFDDVSNYFNSYIKINEEYVITDVMDSKPPNELKIDLRKFEDQIKESYKRGKYSAVIKHNGEKVTSWN